MSVVSVYRPPDLKRFSWAWWKYHMQVQLSGKRLPRLIYIVCGLFLLILWLGIAIGFAAGLFNDERNNRVINSGWSKPSRPFDRNGPLFFMAGQISAFDPSTRSLSVGWSAFVAQGPLPQLGEIWNNQVSVDTLGNQPIAIYRDTIARPDQELIANGSNSDPPPFRLVAPAIKPVGFLGISDVDHIDLDVGLGQKSPSIGLQPELGYPLDVFQGSITFVAANNATIERTGRLGSAVMPIYGALFTDSILNFKVRTSTNVTCLDPDAKGCEITITFWVERTNLVKFCVFVVFVINWIITIAIFLVTGEALLLNRQTILEGTDILAICFTALFALPSVRSLLPGVPVQYGCFLDILGILPNVIIVTLCTAFFTNSRLRMRGRKAAEDAAKAAAEGKGA